MEELGLPQAAAALEPDQARRALDLIVRLSGLSYREIGERSGLSTATVGAKVKGAVRFIERDLLLFAAALDVPKELFLTNPDVILRWWADNRIAMELARWLAA